MALLNPSVLITRGVMGIFRGLRLGNQQSIFSGGALIAIGLWRRARGPDRKLLHRSVLRRGQSLVIRELSGAEEPLVIGGE